MAVPGTADADVEARLINADGSEAEISGNGTRCVAAYLCVGIGEGDGRRIRTGRGNQDVHAHWRATKTFCEFETAMGVPKVENEIAIPTSFGEVTRDSGIDGQPALRGFVEELWPDWQATGGRNPAQCIFKHGVNVELVVIKDK